MSSDVEARVFETLLNPQLDTPFLLYSEERLLEALQFLKASLGEFSVHSPDRLTVYFTLKSCYRPTVAKALRSAGTGVEVMSWNEYRAAKAAGFEGPRILCNGLGRPRDMVQAAIADGARIIIDSVADLTCLLEELQGGDKVVRVGVRVKPVLTGFQTPYADGEHKLGLRVGSPEWEAIVRACAEHPRVELDLLHVHVASVERSSAIYLEALRCLAAARQRLEQTHANVRIRTINLGGGFAGYGPSSEKRAQLLALFKSVGDAAKTMFPNLEIAVEPGRYLVESAGFAVTTVTAVKRDGERTYVVIDAGSNALMPFLDMSYEVLRPRAHPHVGHSVTLVDGITSRSSIILRETFLPTLPQPGDRLIIGNCGAYTTSMCQFWAYDPLPVALLSQTGELLQDLTREQLTAARMRLLGV